jgi:hypothetical protein
LDGSDDSNPELQAKAKAELRELRAEDDRDESSDESLD